MANQIQLSPYSKSRLLRKWVHYLVTAENGRGHGMHSPFVFDFIKNVLNDKKDYPAYMQVEDLRRKLLRDQTKVGVVDLGAGSAHAISNQRTVSEIARFAAKPKKYGQLLYRILRYYKPSTILELGTSLGITSAYLALGAPAAKMITIEGAPGIARLASQNFSGLGIRNIELVEGNFDGQLPRVLDRLNKIDLAFIDGNHRMEPTLNYFHQLLPYITNETVLVFDDIHWSAGMEKAWEHIRNSTEVRCSIDLFFIGIIFFRKEFREPRHFSVRY